MTKIFIDPGHGGTDPGAVGNGLREKDLTLTISKKIESILKGVATVKLSRTNDKTLSLAQRTKMANDWGADYFLSVHINAGGGTGYEDYIYNGSVSSKTVSIRDTIHAEIVKQIPEVRNRGKKRDNFAVVRDSEMPAMLTENLFIDTKADANLLKSNAFLDKVAVGHANGLIKAFNLKGTVNKPTTSNPKAKTTSKSKSSSKGNQTTTSIVDYLKSREINSGLANRKKLAKQYGVKNYTGTASQNNELLRKMRGGSVPLKSTPKKSTALKVGNTVTLKSSATHFATGQTILNSAKGKKYKIIQVKSGQLLLGGIMSWVRNSDVQ